MESYQSTYPTPGRFIWIATFEHIKYMGNIDINWKGVKSHSGPFSAGRTSNAEKKSREKPEPWNNNPISISWLLDPDFNEHYSRPFCMSAWSIFRIQQSGESVIE